MLATVRVSSVYTHCGRENEGVNETDRQGERKRDLWILKKYDKTQLKM